jgi:hypothetical protein
MRSLQSSLFPRRKAASFNKGKHALYEGSGRPTPGCGRRESFSRPAGAAQQTTFDRRGRELNWTSISRAGKAAPATSTPTAVRALTSEVALGQLFTDDWMLRQRIGHCQRPGVWPIGFYWWPGLLQPEPAQKRKKQQKNIAPATAIAEMLIFVEFRG